MAQYRFVVDGDLVRFYDGAQLVTTVRNTSQEIDWYYDNSSSMNFNINGYVYHANSPSEIEIDGQVLSAYSEFDAAINGIFSGVVIPGDGSSLFPTSGTTAATGDVTADLDSNVLKVQQGENELWKIDPLNFTSSFAATDGTASASLLLSSDGNEGNVGFVLGASNGSSGASIEADGTSGTLTLNGAFILPTSDPGVAGALWNNAGTPAISAG